VELPYHFPGSRKNGLINSPFPKHCFRNQFFQDAEDTDDIDTDNYQTNVVENHPLIDEESEHTMLLGQSAQPRANGKRFFAFISLFISPLVHVFFRTCILFYDVCLFGRVV
jgi:hypothetical protein